MSFYWLEESFWLCQSQNTVFKGGGVWSVMQSISSVAIHRTANSLLRLMEYGVIYLGWNVVSHRGSIQVFYIVIDICKRSISNWFQRSLTCLCGHVKYGKTLVEELDRSKTWLKFTSQLTCYQQTFDEYIQDEIHDIWTGTPCICCWPCFWPNKIPGSDCFSCYWL
jgi:hypothetical protein